NNVQDWATWLRVKPDQIRLQQMRRKCASCSTQGWVTFATDLLNEPQEFQNYFIVHELLHFRYKHHGKLFVAALRAYLSTSHVAYLNHGHHCAARGTPDLAFEARHDQQSNNATATAERWFYMAALGPS